MRSAGPGSPIHFKCSAERKELGYQKGLTEHKVTVTGREKPRKRGHSKGLRSTHVQREWICSCGATGWSNHSDLTRSYYQPKGES